MGSLSIQKGKRAEREVANMLNPIVTRVCARVGCAPQKLARNLSQTQKGGFDLDGLDWCAIEIKHHQQVSLGSWWAQTLRQAGADREPLLIWKQHGGKWRARMYGRLIIAEPKRLKVIVDISIDDFLIWFEHRAEAELLTSLQGG